MILEEALSADLPAIATLMNRAFRGGGAEASWNTEAPYIEGDRTTPALLADDVAGKPEARLLVWRTEDGAGLIGSVWLEPMGDDIWYLGSLTVDPARQNGGTGRTLLAASEAWIAARGGRVVHMTVVHVRDTLIAWYERRGYRLTGETEPFPYDDQRFGRPLRPDLHFVVLEKTLPGEAHRRD